MTSSPIERLERLLPCLRGEDAVGVVVRHGPRREHKGAARLTVLLLASTLLGACAGSVEPRKPDGPGVTGRMVLLDDTGITPRPDGGGGMLVVPEAALPDLWPRVGMEGPEDLAYAWFNTDPELLADLGGEVVPVDDDGHFRLTQTGRHLICRLRDPATSGAAPGGANGCDLIDLPRSGALKATFGEGGFHANLVYRPELNDRLLTTDQPDHRIPRAHSQLCAVGLSPPKRRRG